MDAKFKLKENFHIEMEKDTIFLHEDEVYGFKALYYDSENNEEMVIIEIVLNENNRVLFLGVPKRIGWILSDI